MELEAQCEQYRRALDTNRVDHEEVLKMSNHIKNLHSKVRIESPPLNPATRAFSWHGLEVFLTP